MLLYEANKERCHGEKVREDMEIWRVVLLLMLGYEIDTP
jgi:hypothetical protein